MATVQVPSQVQSIIDQLESKALGTVATDAPDWLDKALQQATGALQGLSTVDPAAAAAKAAGLAALSSLSKYKAQIAAMGYQRAVAFLGRVAAGQTSAAQSILLAYGGGQGAWGAADQMIANAADKTGAAAKSDAQALAIVKDVGISGAQAALPLLLAVVLPPSADSSQAASVVSSVVNAATQATS